MSKTVTHQIPRPSIPKLSVELKLTRIGSRRTRIVQDGVKTRLTHVIKTLEYS